MTASLGALCCRCRVEYFIFMLIAEMRGTAKVPLYAIKTDGELNQYPEVSVVGGTVMPSGGDLSNPNDKAVVKGLEDTIIEEYGKALAVNKCKEAGAGGTVNLKLKMLRASCVDTLFKAVDEFKVEVLNLNENQMGKEGAKAIGEALAGNQSLKQLGYAAASTPLDPYCQPWHLLAHLLPGHTHTR